MSKKKAVKAAVMQKEVQAAGTVRFLSSPWLLFLLVALTVWVYGASLHNSFTNWDDEGYILNNDLVKTMELRAIFSSYVMGNYHPITVFVQAVEYSVFGKDAAGYHLVSLLLHLVNVLLLFAFIRLLTQQAVTAFVTALLFAIHPQHVESVSWISAQKDLLYTAGYFAAILFFLQWRTAAASVNATRYYILCIAAFIFSLLSKAQAVTLPVVLLLVDFYVAEKRYGTPWWRLFSRKTLLALLPFFALSIVAGIVAIDAQQQSESIQDLASHSFLTQLLMAAYAYVGYVVKLFVPLNLSAYYPYPEKTGSAYPLMVYTAPVIMAIGGYLLFRFRKQLYPHPPRSTKPAAHSTAPTPYATLLFGLAFFTVNIFLVLQLLPVGGAVMADRYTYLAATGIFFVAGAFIQAVWEKKSNALIRYRLPLLVVTAGWLLLLTVQAHTRTGIWKNSETLWSDVIRKYPRVPIAQNNLGSYLQKQDRPDEAKHYFDAALALQPDFVNALINRCDYFRTKNQIDSALIDGNHAVRLEPLNADARTNRGIAFSIAGKPDSALADFKFVIARRPHDARILNNMGNLFSIKQHYDSALVYYNRALQADPAFLDVLNNRGKCYYFLGNYPKAIADLTRAIANNPSLASNYYIRMLAYLQTGDNEKARSDAAMAQQLGMQIPEAELSRLQ